MAAPASTLFSTGGATDGAISGAIGVVLGRRHSCRQALCWSDALRVGAVTPAAPAVLPSLAAVRGRSEHSSSQACSCHVSADPCREGGVRSEGSIVHGEDCSCRLVGMAGTPC